jgi:hypothetical protein
LAHETTPILVSHEFLLRNLRQEMARTARETSELLAQHCILNKNWKTDERSSMASDGKIIPDIQAS